MVSHDIGTVSSVVDQIACLNKKIHFHGKPEDCIPSDALEKVFGKDMHFLIHDEHCDTCEKR
jgi:zinc transport system ATP-binding protein